MADTTIVFFGIRMEVSAGYVEALETRSHPALVNARHGGLERYWGSFGSAPGERYLQFIGKCLAKIGVEKSGEVQVTAEQIVQVAAEVKTRLVKAGFSCEPCLYIQLEPDF